MNPQELYNSFISFIESGDEEGARKFLIDHLNEFPEETKKEIAFAFFTEAVKNDANLSEAQTKGLKIMKELEEVEAILADASQAASLKEGM